MVGVSYHELQSQAGGSRARHTAGQRKQFLVICVIGAALCANAFINGGIFEEVVIKDNGIYPGGEFVYKLIEDRDFATTGGVWRLMSSDLQPPIDDTLSLNTPPEEEKFDSSLFSVYVDDVNEGVGRYFSGILIDGSKKELKKRLLKKNDEIANLTRDDGGFQDWFVRLRYDVGDLPSVRCAVTTFPYTDGFVSALMHNYKVFPKLYEYAKANLDPKANVIISTNCNRELKVCKHYVPMVQSKKFFMGHPNTEEYLKKNPKEELSLETMLKGVKKLLF